MIDHIWRERLALADRLMAVTSQRAAAFPLACALEAARRRAIEVAKGVRAAVRRRR